MKLDVIANDIFLRTSEYGGHLAGMVSEELEEPYQIPPPYPLGKYLLAFDPLDGSSNIDINAPVGSIFSVLKAPRGMVPPAAEDFLQPGSRQLCAGYAIYGATTMLVLTVGRGVHGFTLDRGFGEFILTHPNMTIPAEASEFAINASNETILGAAGQALCHRMSRRARRNTRQGFQYALDRLAGGGGSSDLDSRRTVHVSEGHQGLRSSRAGCGCCTRPIRWRCSSNRPAARPRRAAAGYWTWCPAEPSPARTADSGLQGGGRAHRALPP